MRSLSGFLAAHGKHVAVLAAGLGLTVWGLVKLYRAQCTALIKKELHLPSSGFVGRVLCTSLFTKANSEVIQKAIERLHIQNGDRVLDIGCGPGTSVAKILESTSAGLVVGLDASGEMIAQSARTSDIAEACVAGRAQLVLGRIGGVGSLPFADNSFDCIMTVNCVYFWTDLTESLREIRRILRPGGRFVVEGAFPTARKVSAANAAFLNTDRLTVLAALRDAGFEKVHDETEDTTSVFGDPTAISYLQAVA